jgi:hypothetical protein
MEWIANDQVVEVSGMPEQDETTLTRYGLIGYAFVAVTAVAATAGGSHLSSAATRVTTSCTCACLAAAGMRLCLDRRDFDVGVPSLENIERAVDQSRHTLLVLTPAWVASEWTAFEQLLTRTADPK